MRAVTPADHDGVRTCGDRALLDELVRQHRDAAVACARRILGDASLAEDAVQRAFLQILLRVRAGDTQLLAANPRAVVLRGTRWAALKIADRSASRDDAERRAAAEALCSADDSDDWERLEARLLVEDILPELPDHYRDVLRLRYLEGRPDARAAQDLEVTVKAYRRRLDRALSVARVAAVRIGATSLGAALLGALRRWRSGLATQPRLAGAHLVIAVAVAGMVTGSTALQRPAPPPHPAPLTGVWTPPPDADARAVGGAAAAAPAGQALGFRPPMSHPRPAGPPAQPQGETVDDISVYSLTPAPHASDNHTAVAEGYGGRCACRLLLQTGDGGATWSIYPSPGDTPLLPPDYPRDPRILFLGDAAGFGAVLCVEPRITAGSCKPLPLSQVSGPVVLDPAFDSGWPLLYASTSAGVVSYDMANHHVRVLALNNGTNLFGGVALSTPGGRGPWALYMLVRGMPLPDASLPTQVGTDSAPLVGTMHLVGCPHQGACQVLGDVTDGAYQLAPDRDDASGTVMAAYDTSGRLTLTGDAGATSRALAVPVPGVLLSLQLMGLPGRLHMSALTMDFNGRMRLSRWEEATGWSVAAIDAVAPPVTAVFQAALGGGRVIVADSSFKGLHCSTDAGLTWTAFCPPA